MQSKKKISIIGAGNVGSTIAYTLIQQGTCSEILLVDINRDKAEGESLDLAQCAACFPSVKVRFGEYEDAAGSDIVIATLGVGRKPGQSRLDLAKINVGIIESVMPKVAKIAPDAIYIIVSNPVDVLTYVTVRCTGLPASRVVGTGTLLDSNRLSQAIAEYLDVDIKSVNSYVFGEHGDQCFVPWSLCTVGGVPVKAYARELFGEEADIDGNFKDLYDKVVKSGAKVIQLKGARKKRRNSKRKSSALRRRTASSESDKRRLRGRVLPRIFFMPAVKLTFERNLCYTETGFGIR